jgi:F-type H+-transporting ATPase subunit b
MAVETNASTEAEHSAGLPQFQFQHWGGQIGYLLILFVALYILMSKVFAPRIRRVFDERARVISEALTSARAVQTEAADQAEAAKRALAEARASAQKTAADAKAKAGAEAAEREAALEAELGAKQAQAEERIRVARDGAMSQLATVATDAAQAMVEKLTGAKVSRDDVAAAVKVQG